MKGERAQKRDEGRIDTIQELEEAQQKNPRGTARAVARIRAEGKGKEEI